MSQMWLCRAGSGFCGSLLSGPPGLRMECVICSFFHLPLLEIISMSSFLKGLAISVKLHVNNEYL